MRWLAKIETGAVWLLGLTIAWQMRHTFLFAELGGFYFEYGSIHVYAADLVLALLLILWALSPSRNRFRLGPIPIFWGLVVWVVWQSLSVFWASDWKAALWHAGQTWLWFGGYLYVINRVRKAADLIWPILVGLAVQAVVGIGQYFLNSSLGLGVFGESVLSPSQGGVPVVVQDGLHRIRAHGLMPHANILGGWLAAAIGWLLWLFYNMRQPVMYWVVATLLIFGAALSYSRVSWGILVVGLAIVLIGEWVNSKQWFRSVSKVAGWLLVVWTVVLVTQLGWVLGRFDLTERLENKSITDRRASVSQSVNVWKENPILGTGVGGYSLAASRADTAAQPAWIYQPVHNVFLLTLVELGGVGIVLLVGLTVVVGRFVWLAILRNPRLGFLAWPLITWYLIGFLDHWPTSLHQGWALWFMALALIILESQLEYKSQNN